MIETLNLRIDELCRDGQHFSHDREVSMVILRMANTLTQSVEYLLTDTYHKSTVGEWEQGSTKTHRETKAIH